MSTDSKQLAAGIGFEKCERLLANPDVAWLISEAITKPRKEAEATLRDLGTSKDARENAAHVLAALETAEQFLITRRDIYKRELPK